MQRSDNITDLAASLVEAQKQIVGAAKGAFNPHFKSHYADLSAVAEACKKPLNDHGIAYVQTPEPSEPGTLQLTTALVHRSGQWISGTCTMPLPQNTPQAYGSALTYARRYGLASIVGVCPDDDDGEGAEGRDKKPQQQRQQQSSPPNEDQKFLIQLAETFDSRDFQEKTRKGIVAAVCKKQKIKAITDLSAEDRKLLVDKISAGEFDKLKNGQQQAAGAK